MTAEIEAGRMTVCKVGQRAGKWTLRRSRFAIHF